MDILIAFFIAFIISFVSTPLVIKFANRIGLLDDPQRKHPAIIHTKPIPRGGGVAPFIGFGASILLIISLSNSLIITKPLFGILVAAFLLVLIGLLDDKFDLNPYLRLFANIIVAGIVVGFGVGISSFTNPFGGQINLDSIVYSFSLPSYFGILSGHHSIVLLADIIAFLWIIWIMNALNWSSGVDGQLTGIVSIALVILGIVSVSLVQNDPSQFLTATIAFAAAGSFLGFLPWSFYPQKIMPGYGGATLAGFLIAVLAILTGAKMATVLLVLLIPLVDSFWAVVRRIANKRSPVWGDNLHLHHQLLKLGFTVPQVCLIYYLAGILLGILGLNLDSQKKFFAIAIIGVVIFSLLFTIFFVLKRLTLNNVKNS